MAKAHIPTSHALQRMQPAITAIEKVQQVDGNSQKDNDLYSDTGYLNAVNKTSNDKQWHVTVQIESNPVSFKGGLQ